MHIWHFMFIFTSHKYVGSLYTCHYFDFLCQFWFKVWWFLYVYHLDQLFWTTEMKNMPSLKRCFGVSRLEFFFWSFPALSKSDVSIPTWNVFGTLITNPTRDLIHCMETARVSQALLHVQHMWGKKTAREGQMDRSSGAWLRYVATTPDVLHLWIYGSHPCKTHRQWSQNRGWPAHSIHKRHPPSTQMTELLQKRLINPSDPQRVSLCTASYDDLPW